MTQLQLKQAAARAALKFVEDDTIIGVGTGSTVNCFIECLAEIKHQIEGAVSSSDETSRRLKQLGIPVYDLNAVDNIKLYVDGADEINNHLAMIKGGGGALTREKVIAAVAEQFICIADASKQVNILGEFPLPIEVIPLARSYVGRELVKLGGDPVYRDGYVTDNGNIIIDVYNLTIDTPIALEEKLNNITGVVTNGIFAKRPADRLLLATEQGVQEITKS